MVSCLTPALFSAQPVFFTVIVLSYPTGLYGTALLTSFKAFLHQGGKQRPKPEVLNKIQRYYHNSLIACGDPTVAAELYERAARVPDTVTRKDIATSRGILVDGLFSPPNEASSTLLYAYHQGKIMLLKVARAGACGGCMAGDPTTPWLVGCAPGLSFVAGAWRVCQ
jgi:hypothetical protein